MEEKKKKVSKCYNPYPFLVRVLNDLKKPQLLAPQAHCKVMGGKYDQSLLVLVPVDKRGERIYSTGMKIELRRLPKEDLVNLAWAVLVHDTREGLESMTNKKLIEAIKEKTGEKPSDVEPSDIDEETPENSKEEVKTEEKTEEEKVQEYQDDTERMVANDAELQEKEKAQDKETIVEEKPQKSGSRKKRKDIQQEE